MFVCLSESNRSIPAHKPEMEKRRAVAREIKGKHKTKRLIRTQSATKPLSHLTPPFVSDLH